MKQHRNILKMGMLFFLLALSVGLAMLVGRFPHAGLQNPLTLVESEMQRSILLHIRFPRIVISLLLGMSLSVAGLIFQTVLNNPMMEPGFLGVSQGAAFGAALAITLFSTRAWQVQTFAFLFGLTGFLLSLALTKVYQMGHWALRIVLAGITVSAFFSAFIGLLKYIADVNDRLQMLSFWLLGGTNGVRWEQIMPILPVMAVSFGVIFAMRWRVNLLSLDEDTAHSISVNLKAERMILLIAAVLITSACISLCGIVSWVGLIVPHFARKLFGADTRWTLPASLLLGGIFMVVSDGLARTVFAFEIPLGVVTALIGAAMFLPVMALNQIDHEKK